MCAASDAVYTITKRDVAVPGCPGKLAFVLDNVLTKQVSIHVYISSKLTLYTKIMQPAFASEPFRGYLYLLYTVCKIVMKSNISQLII